jgi:Enoyl-(Acyl carrier protein) reductase/NADH:flavin oxidoreductase / NADH oxidase family
VASVVNNIQPGPIDTDLNPAAGDWAAPQKANTALGRYGIVNEVAALVAFVAGPAASYITGASLTVDGGTNSIIAAGGFDREGAEAIVEAGAPDLVAFGRHFTSNPDLQCRLKHKLPLTPYVRNAFWGGNEHGYSDFPALEPVEAKPVDAETMTEEARKALTRIAATRQEALLLGRTPLRSGSVG